MSPENLPMNPSQEAAAKQAEELAQRLLNQEEQMRQAATDTGSKKENPLADMDEGDVDDMFSNLTSPDQPKN